MVERYQWIFEKDGEKFDAQSSVERWNREDNEGIWLEDVARKWGPQEGRGLGLGNGYSRVPGYYFDFQPYSLFNESKKH